jgi:hypothetical protein
MNERLVEHNFKLCRNLLEENAPNIVGTKFKVKLPYGYSEEDKAEIKLKLDKKFSYWFARYMVIKLLDETKSDEQAFNQIVKEILNDTSTMGKANVY